MKEDKPKLDWMLDLETTGLNPEVHAITSIALVQFQPGVFTDEHPPRTWFHTRLELPHVRYLNPEAMAWRKEHNVDSMEASLPIMLVADFLNKMHDFLSYDGRYEPVIWAKPTVFDIAFLASYYREFADGNMPWHYRDVVDLNSFIRGRGYKRKAVEGMAVKMLDWEAPHNAMYDAVYQIAMIASCYKPDADYRGG